MRDNFDHTAGREPTPTEKRKLQFSLMFNTLDRADYPSRQTMRADARRLLKTARSEQKVADRKVARAKLKERTKPRKSA